MTTNTTALVAAARAIYEAEIADRPARATLSGATYALVPLALYMPLKQAVEDICDFWYVESDVELIDAHAEADTGDAGVCSMHRTGLPLVTIDSDGPDVTASVIASYLTYHELKRLTYCIQQETGAKGRSADRGDGRELRRVYAERNELRSQLDAVTADMARLARRLDVFEAGS